MTRYVIASAVSLGLGYCLLRWLLGYKSHVPHPQFKSDFAKLPDPRSVGRRDVSATAAPQQAPPRSFQKEQNT